jgi:hypothetical protein
MGLFSPIIHFIGKQMLEKPAQKKGYEQLKQDLQANKATLIDRLQKANAKEERNHTVMTHIIGIERWAQTRLREFLGEAPGEAEYDHYRPARDTDWAALLDLFEQTRTETLTLLQQLQEATPQQTIKHNTFGPLSDKGWLRYMTTHAEMESKRLS